MCGVIKKKLVKISCKPFKTQEVSRIIFSCNGKVVTLLVMLILILHFYLFMWVIINLWLLIVLEATSSCAIKNVLLYGNK
jgi:hypothetical protein